MKCLSYLGYRVYNKGIVLWRKLFYRGKRYRPRKLRGKRLLSAEEGNLYLKKLIESGQPFCAVRYGGSELNTYCEGKEYLLGLRKNMRQSIADTAQRQGGFFPADTSYLPRFSQLMEELSPEIDYLACYASFMENYMVRHYCKKELCVADNRALEPYYFKGDSVWSAALEGKKVLVIHPFAASIRSQYENNRTKLFRNPHILPEFQLITMKAVQTIAGTPDPRFRDWFEALEYMEREALKLDFDIALVGCGYYGLPLACLLKRAGKQVIHIGGATQILFGIKGRRWELNSKEVSALFNENWIRPTAEETPANKSANEFGGSYW